MLVHNFWINVQGRPTFFGLESSIKRVNFFLDFFEFWREFLFTLVSWKRLEDGGLTTVVLVEKNYSKGRKDFSSIH